MKVFSDRNFYNLPTNENFCTSCEFHKNRKKVKIPEIIYGMSSFWDEFLRLKMGRLGVRDGLETNSWPHRHSGCDFKKWWIFMIFDFLNCGFWHLSGRISNIRPNIGRSIWFSKKVHWSVFPNPRGNSGTHIPLLYIYFCPKYPKIVFSTVLYVEYSTTVEYSTVSEISTIKKFGT